MTRGSIKEIGGSLHGGAIDEAADKLGHPPPAPVGVRTFPEWPKEDRHRRRLWEMEWDYICPYKLGGIWYRIIVPAGYLYDGASIPRPVWGFIAEDKLHRQAGPHDRAYELGGIFPPGEWQWLDGYGIWRDVDREMPRKESDQALRVMARVGPQPCSTTEAALAYAGVRVGGRWSWGPKAPRTRPEAQ